jgi:hypothetical protein
LVAAYGRARNFVVKIGATDYADGAD